MRVQSRQLLVVAAVAAAIVALPVSAASGKGLTCKSAPKAIRAAIKDLDASFGIALIITRRDIRNAQTVATLRKAWEADPSNKTAYNKYLTATGERDASLRSLALNAKQRSKDYKFAADTIFDAQKLNCPPREDRQIGDLLAQLLDMQAGFNKRIGALRREYRKIQWVEPEGGGGLRSDAEATEPSSLRHSTVVGSVNES